MYNQRKQCYTKNMANPCRNGWNAQKKIQKKRRTNQTSHDASNEISNLVHAGNGSWINQLVFDFLL
jgi:hypothetical protein